MSLNNKNNYLTYKFNETTFEQFCLISQPLFEHLNITHFCYLKLYPDGKYISFSNDLEWQKQYYQTIEDNVLILPGEKLLRYIGKNNQYLLSSWPKNDHSQVGKEVLKKDFGEGISITRLNPGYAERWGIFKNNSDFHIDVLFDKYVNLLIQFLDYFNLRMDDILNKEKYYKYELAFFNKGVIYPDKLPELSLKNDEINNFLNAINKPGENNSNNVIKKIKFTPREIESLRHLSLGESIKEIASNLHLSPRTIEEYINNIKLKTKYNNRSQLVQMYLNIQENSNQ